MLDFSYNASLPYDALHLELGLFVIKVRCGRHI